MRTTVVINQLILLILLASNLKPAMTYIRHVHAIKYMRCFRSNKRFQSLIRDSNNRNFPIEHTKFMASRSIFNSVLITTSAIIAASPLPAFASTSIVKQSMPSLKSTLASSTNCTELDTCSDPPTNPTDQVIRKRANDKRQYEALTLANDMRVLLISDPASVNSAAALDVHVGSLSDPIDIPGLAHFCEHMSFLGTKKYPAEDDYSNFLAARGGSSNAYTDTEDTVYFFDVNTESLESALDRFSQFFVSPLFTASATARELNAIDSEHAKNINDDGFRFYQLDREMASPSHPLTKFSTGNRETLETVPKQRGIDVRSALLRFHGMYYSANLMTLCVYGSQPLSVLRQWTERYFSSVPNRLTTNPSLDWWGSVQPYPRLQCATLTKVVPITDMRRLYMCFPVPVPSPAALQTQLRLKPDMFISHLLGHEGRGGIISALKNLDWASGLQAALSIDTSDTQLFEVVMDLTETGLGKIDEICEVVFAYMQLLNTKLTDKGGSTLPEYLLKEVAQLSRISFEYAESSDPPDYVSSIVSHMQVYNRPKDYLTGPVFYPQVGVDVDRNALIKSLVDYMAALIPSQCRVRVASKSFKGQTDTVAKYYGTEYAIASLPQQTQLWSRVRVDPSHITIVDPITNSKQLISLFLPEINVLIPEDFRLIGMPLPDDASAKDVQVVLKSHPTVIRSDDRWTVWHKLDRSFAQPKAYIVTSLAIDRDLYDPTAAVAAKLFSDCFLDSINEYLYDARLAGLSFQLDLASRGVQLTFTGFNDKLSAFVSTITKSLRSYKPDERAFNRYKDALRREYVSWRTQQPYYHCNYFANLVSETNTFDIASLEAALEAIALPTVGGLLTRLLRRSFGTILAIGNMKDSTALKIVESIDGTFRFTPLPRSQRCVKEPFLIPRTPATSTAIGYRLSHPGPNTNDDNSASTFYFQQPSRAMRDYLLVELLADVIEQPFYNSLRTQQQLGYIVYSGVKARLGTYTLLLTAQSNVVDGDELTLRVQSFLRDADTLIANLSEEEFETFREGLQVRKSEPDRRLTGQASRFWGEILQTDALVTAATLRALEGDKYEGQISNVSARNPESLLAEQTPTDPASISEPLFDRYEEEVQVLSAISLSDFKSFARDFLASPPGGKFPSRHPRLLVSQVTSVKAPKGAAKALSATPAYIDIIDEATFALSLPKL